MLSKESKVTIFVGDMAKDSSMKHIVHIRAHKVGDRNIIIKVQMHYFFYTATLINCIYIYIYTYMLCNIMCY